jgi:hypothetical protein
MAVINALTTLANAKIVAGIPSSVTTYDATLEYLINKVSGKIRNYLGRTLARSTTTEKLPATSRQYLILKEWPIVSITSLSSSDTALTLNTDYRLDAQDMASGMVYRELGWEPRVLVTGLVNDIVAAARTLDIVYVAGYYLPADVTVAPADPHYVAGDASSLPLEISGIVDEMVVEEYLRIKTHSQGVTGYSEGGISYTWAGSRNINTVNMGISDEHAVVLNNYKRTVIA